MIDAVRSKGECAHLEELSDALAALEAARRSIDGAQLGVIGEVARRSEARGPDGYVHPVRGPEGEVADIAPDVVALTIDAGPTEALLRCRDAVGVARTPAVLDALAAGAIRERTTRLVVQETADASPTACAAIAEHLMAPVRGRPGSTRLTDLEPREVARACRRVLERVDRGALDRRAERNRLTKLNVDLEPGPLGTSYLTATLPSEVGQVVMASVDQLAHQIKGERPYVPIGVARAQALADLALRGVRVRTEVAIGVPIVTSGPLMFAPTGGGKAPQAASSEGECVGLRVPSSEGEWAAMEAMLHAGVRPIPLSRSDLFDPELSGIVRLASETPGPSSAWIGGVEVPGVGYIPSEVVARISTHVDTRVARVLLDAHTGVTLATSAATYRAPKGVRRLIEARDGRCRMWGCERPAVSCDLDHATPWPKGATEIRNLAALCRHHHRVKHAPGWAYRLDDDGTVTWTSPAGTSAVSFPAHHVAQVPEARSTEMALPPPVGAKDPSVGAALADSPPRLGAKASVEDELPPF